MRSAFSLDSSIPIIFFLQKYSSIAIAITIAVVCGGTVNCNPRYWVVELINPAMYNPPETALIGAVMR